MGTWLDCDHTCGIQGSFFILGSQSTGTTIGSADGSTILARPFINAGSGTLTALSLNPSFAADRIEYAATVPYDATAVALSAVPLRAAFGATLAFSFNGGAYPVTNAYDMATGWGTLNATRLAADLVSIG